MKILVTGATGFLGSWVVRELVSRRHEVRVLLRKTSSRANLEGLEVESLEGDVCDPASVRRALPGCQGLVHTAGVAHFQPGDTERMYAVNHKSVEIVLDAALEAGVERAVLTSSAAAMGGAKEPRVADETTPSTAEGSGIHYFISKHRGEQAALERARRGLHLCTVRPVVLLGPGDIYHSSATTFLALARRRLPAFVPGGASFTDVRDVARGHADALERGGRGEVYILGGTNLEMEAMVRIVARVAGVPPPRRAPYALVYAVASAVELLGKLTRRKVSLSRELVRASSLYTFVTSAKAQRDLGYRFRPFEESLRDTLRYFLRAGRLKPATPELAALLV
jgi:dihydroflavonol-4-reductase